MKEMRQCFAYLGHGSPDSELVCACGKPALRRVKLAPDAMHGWRTVGFCKDHIAQASIVSSVANEKKSESCTNKFKAGMFKRRPKWCPAVSDHAQ